MSTCVDIAAAGFSIFELATDDGTAFWLFPDDDAVDDFATREAAEHEAETRTLELIEAGMVGELDVPEDDISVGDTWSAVHEARLVRAGEVEAWQ